MGFTMNVLLALIIFYSNFQVRVEGGIENKSDERCIYLTPKHNPSLILVRENYNLKLAVPVRVQYTDNQQQSCYSTLQGELLNFCPPIENQPPPCATQSGCSDEKNLLFFAQTENDSIENGCKNELRPTIKPISNEKPCFIGETETGQEYEVGYTVWDDKTMAAQHLWIYKVCYSGDNGTLYTFHTITPLNSEFDNDYKELKNEYIIKSELAENKWSVNILRGRKNYQFVNSDDMPTNSWIPPTLFDFNIISIKGKDILARLQTVDNIIRKSVIQIQKFVTVYTGKFQLTKEKIEQIKDKIKVKMSTFHMDNILKSNHLKKALHHGKELLKLESSFIWKILWHETEGAIAIITQINQSAKCVQICSNVASNENWPEFKILTSEKCTYACEVTDKMKKQFGLTYLGNIPKILNIQYVSAETSKNYEYYKQSKETLKDEKEGKESKGSKKDKHNKESDEYNHKTEKISFSHLFHRKHNKEKNEGKKEHGEKQEKEKEEEEGSRSSSSSEAHNGSEGETHGGGETEGGEETLGGGEFMGGGICEGAAVAAGGCFSILLECF